MHVAKTGRAEPILVPSSASIRCRNCPEIANCLRLDTHAGGMLHHAFCRRVRPSPRARFAQSVFLNVPANNIGHPQGAPSKRAVLSTMRHGFFRPVPVRRRFSPSTACAPRPAPTMIAVACEPNAHGRITAPLRVNESRHKINGHPQ